MNSHKMPHRCPYMGVIGVLVVLITLGVYHTLMTRIRRMVADQIEEAVTFLRIERDH